VRFAQTLERGRFYEYPDSTSAGRCTKIPEGNADKSGRQHVIDRARRDYLTVRQLARIGGSYGGLATVSAGHDCRPEGRMVLWQRLRRVQTSYLPLSRAASTISSAGSCCTGQRKLLRRCRLRAQDLVDHPLKLARLPVEMTRSSIASARPRATGPLRCGASRARNQVRRLPAVCRAERSRARQARHRAYVEIAIAEQHQHRRQNESHRQPEHEKSRGARGAGRCNGSSRLTA
jgi:hypothetical protein